MTEKLFYYMPQYYLCFNRRLIQQSVQFYCIEVQKLNEQSRLVYK